MIPGLVSVVICAWNNWPDLEMTIESALHQSFQPVEVIVVDNSSTDATPAEVPSRFGRRVRYIRQLNKDTAGAYNAGFEVARGEFLQFLDGDDLLAPNKLEKQIEVFRADLGVEIVYGDIGIFQTSAGAPSWNILPTRPEEDMLKAVLCSAVGICTDVGMLFHRSALEKVGPWDEKLYVEDLDYLLRAAWAGCRFGHCQGGPMGFARVHPCSKTQNTAAMDQGNEAVLNKALDYVTREPYRSLLAANLAHLRFHMAVSSDRLPAQEALAKLALARRTSPQAISAMKYAAAWVIVAFPGGRHLTRLPRLQAIRRTLARLLRYRSQTISGGKDRANGTAAQGRTQRLKAAK
jgi:glycosyltransferase involved in cell wall biosynthesis